MFLKRSLVSGANLAMAAALAGVGSAHADPGLGLVECEQNPHPGCELVAGTGGGNSAGGGGTGGASGGHANTATSVVNCGGPLDPLCSANGAIQNSAPSPADLAQLARSQLHLPAPGIAANPTGEQLVYLPTWLWLRDGWREVSATAAVPGVSVTAVARPRAVTWSMGDGSVVSCTGPGMAFPEGGDPRSPSPTCGYTYRSSSAGQPNQVYRVTATMHWTVAWSGAGAGGSFPELTTTSNTAFRVAEAQAVNSGG